jgi:glycosyltransferase involved in cell wall biosynthesis
MPRPPNSMPLVSVVIPHRNGIQYLDESLASVAAQDYANFEIVLVDDGSDTPIPDRLLQGVPRLTLIALPERRGVAGALNAGIRACCGSYIARHDADDIMLPQRLRLQVKRLEDSSLPRVDVLAGQLETFPTKRWYAYPTSVRGFQAGLLFGNPIAHPTVMLRREVCINNPYSERTEDTGLEDLELWIRLARQGYKFGCLSEVLTHYRLHPAQSTRTITHRNDGRLLTLAALVSAPRKDLVTLALARDQSQPISILRGIVGGRFNSDTYAVLQIYQNWLNVSARHKGGLSLSRLLAKGLTQLMLPLLRKQHSHPAISVSTTTLP